MNPIINTDIDTGLNTGLNAGIDTFEVKGRSGNSTIYVGERLPNLRRHIPPEQTVILTDEIVRGLYGHQFPDGPVIEIGLGERHKTLDTVRTIYDQLVVLEADRSTMIVGIGGGIVCDVAGFVASTYMRGIACGFVASTLLAQVDASVGGKNGVNLGGYKNMVGVFNQPRFVICDPEMLKTLPTKERLCGMAEIVKHAVLADDAMFAFLEQNTTDAVALETEVTRRLVLDSVKIKAGIVNADEHEHGERRKLNLGHTFGHAIEKVCGLAHGEAVSIGMNLAAAISVHKGLLARAEHERLVALLTAMGMPTQPPVPLTELTAVLGLDKKREQAHIHFVLPETIGRAVVVPLRLDEIAAIGESLELD